MNHFGSTFILCFLGFLFIQANAINSWKTCSAHSDCQATGEYCEKFTSSPVSNRCNYCANSDRLDSFDGSVPTWCSGYTKFADADKITLTSSSVLTYVKQAGWQNDVSLCPSFDACTKNCRKEYSVEKTASQMTLKSTFTDTADCVCDKVVFALPSADWGWKSASTTFGTVADTVELWQYSADALDIYVFQQNASPATVDCVWEYSIGTISSLTPAPSITTTGDCKCTCCSGNSCTSSVVGYLNAGSSSSCTSDACRTTFPSTCPASGSSGSVMSTYSSSSTTTDSTGGFALSSGDKYSFVSESSSCPNFGACTNICRNGYQVTKNSDTSYVFKSTQTPSGPDCTVCFDIPVSGSSTATALTGSTTAQGTPVQFSITTPSSSSLLVTASVSGVGTCSWTYSKQTSAPAPTPTPTLAPSSSNEFKLRTGDTISFLSATCSLGGGCSESCVKNGYSATVSSTSVSLYPKSSTLNGCECYSTVTEGIFSGSSFTFFDSGIQVTFTAYANTVVASGGGCTSTYSIDGTSTSSGISLTGLLGLISTIFVAVVMA